MPLMNYSLDNIELFWFVVASLATARITSIILKEKIAMPIRWLVGVRQLESGDLTYPDNFLGNLFSCHWCLSVWVGLGVTLVWLTFPYILIPFALSSVSIVLNDGKMS